MKTYTRENTSPVEGAGWAEYRQRGTRWMIPAKGPLRVVTKEGAYDLPDGWEGFIAVDSLGYPYPIDGAEHTLTYMRVGA